VLMWALALGVLLHAGAPTQACEWYTITAYAVEQFPGRTADGTPTPGNAGRIAAASPNLPFGTYVAIEGVGVFRIADRGLLGPRHIDILLQTVQEARQFGRQTRWVCPVTPPHNEEVADDSTP
jgi:3D (Asp-Asp-Asp) domain-containing protein